MLDRASHSKTWPGKGGLHAQLLARRGEPGRPRQAWRTQRGHRCSTEISGSNPRYQSCHAGLSNFALQLGSSMQRSTMHLTRLACCNGPMPIAHSRFPILQLHTRPWHELAGSCSCRGMPHFCCSNASAAYVANGELSCVRGCRESLGQRDPLGIHACIVRSLGATQQSGIAV